MPAPLQLRIQRSVAYACFLVPGVVVLLSVIAEFVPSGVMEPAYFGFFVLIPLTLASAIAIPVALVLAFKVGRREPALIVLSVATVLVAAGALSGLGDGRAMTAVFAVYCLLVAVLEVRWFVFGRRSIG